MGNLKSKFIKEKDIEENDKESDDDKDDDDKDDKRRNEVRKEFKIKFEHIKRLSLYKYNINSYVNYNYFLKQLFSLFEVKNSLLFLKIEINNNYNEIIKRNSIINLNKCKLLQYLDLKGFINFNITLKLYNLKKLFLSNCSRIKFDENCLLNIKELSFDNCYFPTQTKLLKCPNLEKCILDNHNKYNLIFDFPSFIKLKELKCKMKIFYI